MSTNGKDYEFAIPKFSIKSALLLLLAGLLGGGVIPYLFYELQWDTRIAVMLFLPLFISFSLAYGHCFFDTKIGLGKRFWKIVIISFIILEVLSYFWLFKGFIF